MFQPIARRRSLAIVFALVALASLAASRAAEAQFLPAVLYGGGLKAGQKVEAFIGGVSCGSTTASAKGEWVLQIPAEAPCKPQASNGITFKVDGVEATSAPAATWESGGIPTGSVKTGYTLSAGGGAGSGSSAGASEDSDDGGSSPVIFIAIGVVVLAAVAGGGWFMLQRRGSA